MKSRVTVIDYGIGNVLSVCRAFEHVGAEVLLTNAPSEIESAERLVLPGVGAFADGMQGLREKGLDDAVRRFTATSRPFLGICLGMQMMLEVSEEFGTHAGLGLIPGKVVSIPATGADGKLHKIPHIGWNALVVPTAETAWGKSILAETAPGTAAYFVHSFTAVPAQETHRLADCLYNGRRISAAIQSENMFGCQFHPEKSGSAGLKMIENFMRRS
jgi:glutamine amidotransferase